MQFTASVAALRDTTAQRNLFELRWVFLFALRRASSRLVARRRRGRYAAVCSFDHFLAFSAVGYVYERKFTYARRRAQTKLTTYGIGD